jgi:hypothetical protein
MNIACHLKYALFVVAGIMVVVLLSKWTGKKAVVGAGPSQVQQVVNQAAEHNTSAHSQHDAVVALVDVTTALASLNTAVALSGEECVKKAAGVPTRTLENEMVAYQRKLMRQLGEHPTGTLPPLPSV